MPAPSRATFRIDIHDRSPSPDAAALDALHGVGLAAARAVYVTPIYFVDGDLLHADVARLADRLLVEPVTQTAVVTSAEHPPRFPAQIAVEVQPRPGVMDPVAESALNELRAEGWAVQAVRTARRIAVDGDLPPDALADAVRCSLANECIERIVPGTLGVAGPSDPPLYEFRVRHVPLGAATPAELEQLSRRGHLFLSLAELQAIQSHYRALGREPTDLELETLAQTWSEHCVHKTLKSAFEYQGAALPASSGAERRAETPDTEVRRYDNLLRDTIARATRELAAAGRGPECLSVFVDNAGVIGFDEQYGVAVKVETHNRPSAIEPYGGAATGVGGVIRDVLGCGLGAKPVASTDVFCVAPADWTHDDLPPGVLHPRRVLRGVVRGVADYGNRMGIPTVNGAVFFDPRYLGNPLVFCGCVGLIPRNRLRKAAQPGDCIVLVGGRTGRDGIHGATFSSAELTSGHADEFSHAVQIGNAITEKRVLDAVLRARDAAEPCLFNAITDCGAGGLSSAIGEMAADVGAQVDLDRVPLKYAGLRYDEIWISEAQERMVLAAPPESLDSLMAIMRAEQVEATVIGTFGAHSRGAAGEPRLIVKYQGVVVGDLDLAFMHDGLPRSVLSAAWTPPAPSPCGEAPRALTANDREALLAQLRRPTIASKEWIIRRYDHEVQGASVLKPLLGAGRGPGDAAVLRPRLDNGRAIAVGCGLCPQRADVDPYWMAAAAIDEAVRNVVSVGGDPRRVALLDNFCWGRTDDPQQRGALVRACQACYDVAIAYGAPFISGKDSLNNEFALQPADVEPLIAAMERWAARAGAEGAALRASLSHVVDRIRRTRRLAIPPTLLITAVAVADDAARCVSSDFKRGGDSIVIVGGLPATEFSLEQAARVHRAVSDAIHRGLAAACHDVSDGGWLTAAAEMAIGGGRGAELVGGATCVGPFEECVAAYVVETSDAGAIESSCAAAGVRCERIGRVIVDEVVRWPAGEASVAALREAWRSEAW